MTDSDVYPEDTASAGLELRILAGRHAGAIVRLPASAAGEAASMSIGPGLDHDIVVSDASGSATLSLSEAGWQWAEENFTASLAEPGRWRWGSVQLAMGPAGSSWDKLPEHFDRSELALASPDAEPAKADSGSGAAVAAEGPGASADSPTPSVSSKVEAPAPSATDSTRRFGSPSLGLAMLAIIAIGAVSLIVLPKSRVEAPPAARETTANPLPPDPTAIEAMLRESGLESQVRVLPQADGRFRLVGVVAQDEDLDRMIAKVSRVTRRIIQGVITQEEFTLRVRELQTEVPFPVALRVVPVGRIFVIEDEGLSFDQVALESWLKRALPETVEFAVVARTELTEIVASVTPHSPEAPEPPPPGIPQALPDLPSDEPPFPPLPPIRLVVGGRSPYVMLASGEKWLPGGRVGGWTLSSVESEAFVIEDVRGRRVRSPR